MNKSQWPQKFLCVALVGAIFIAGCGGHVANPVPLYHAGDENRSCNALRAQMSQLDQDLIAKNSDKDTRDTWNIIEFVSGFFLLVPWFFMDVKGSHEVEIEAYKARKRALAGIYHDKNCDAPSATTGTAN